MSEVTAEEMWRFLRESRERTEEEFRKTDEAIRRLTRRMESFSDRLGDFAVGMVLPAAETIFQDRGIPVDGVSREVRKTRNGRQMEIDILVENDRHVVAIEVKSRLKTKHVADHLDRLAAFKDFFTQYQDYKLYGALAAMVVDEEAARHAYRQGLFVLGQSGETVSILNDRSFAPRVW